MLKKILAKTFGALVNIRNKKYDENGAVIQVSTPVISVGNLSVGGTGKTPFVIMLAKYFLSKNLKPGIVGLGYKRKSDGEIIVCDGNSILVDAETAGDEMLLIALSLNVPVIAHESKSEAAKSMAEKFKPDVILVDDGFQHRNLYRDLDIVLIDRETVENPHLMPEGRLREPIESLKRADIVSFTGNFEITQKILDNIDETAVQIKVKALQGTPYQFYNSEKIDTKEVRQIKSGIVAFAGIAKPNKFRDMLQNSGYNIADFINFSDHHIYKESDIKKISDICKKNNVNFFGTTEKDFVKISKFKNQFQELGLEGFVFPIALHISEGKHHFFKTIDSVVQAYKSDKAKS